MKYLQRLIIEYSIPYLFISGGETYLFHDFKCHGALNYILPSILNEFVSGCNLLLIMGIKNIMWLI